MIDKTANTLAGADAVGNKVTENKDLASDVSTQTSTARRL